MNNNLRNNGHPSREEIIRNEKKRKARKYKRIDTTCIIIFAAVFYIIVIINLFQFNRPSESEVEKRKLASFPELTWDSLVSGDFTEGINKFFADTFIFRDSLVSASKTLDSLKGFDISLKGGNNFAVIDTGKDKKDDKGIGDLLDNITKETESPVNTETEPKDTEPVADSLSLSKTALSMTVGSGAKIEATSSLDAGNLVWDVDNDDVVEITITDKTANVKALAAGNAVITCQSGTDTVTCNVTVSGVAANSDGASETADFMGNGFFIYGDAVYTQPWYSEEHGSNYFKVASYYKTLFPKTRVSVIIAPTSAIEIDDEEVQSQLSDQRAIFERLAEFADENVNFVDTYNELYDHRGQYLYFKTDHHWTQRGAYYSYKAFVESIGLECPELSDFNYVILNDNYSGSLYDYTQDIRVKSFSDIIEAFFSKKNMTMTITTRSGEVQTYNSAIMDWSNTYASFICGDNPYTVINVPENPQDLNILVFKDSYGNALVPFLAENFGNIMVVDVRYSDMNVKDTFADYDLTDILFINNLEAANSPAWSKLYLKAVGITD